MKLATAPLPGGPAKRKAPRGALFFRLPNVWLRGVTA